MNTTKTRLTTETSLRLVHLCTSLKAWNIIAALYAASDSPAEDTVHAYATEARRLVQQSIVLTCRFLVAVIEDSDRSAAAKLLLDMLKLERREKHLARLCRETLSKVYRHSATTAEGKENHA